jgi:hypothetical protein
MARFIANIVGQAGPTSRIGSARSGIRAHVRGWDIGVLVAGGAEGETDEFDVWLTSGSNGRTGDVLIGTARLDEDGRPVFTPGGAPS